MFDLKRFQQNIAFYDEMGQSVSYGDIDFVAHGINEKIGKRNLVFLLCNNKISALVYYVALLSTDNVIFLIPNTSREEWVKRYISSFQPDYLCVPVECAASLYEVHRYGDYSIRKSHKAAEYTINPNLALLLASSGSTGECKFVRQSKRNIKDNTRAIVRYLGLSCEDKPILSLPMSYTYGLSVIHTHLFVGATILLTEKKIIQKEFWDFFNQCRGTSFSGVPYHYEMLYRFGFMKWNMPYLTCLTQAGGKLSEELVRKYNQYASERKVRFYTMYGQTEATARMAYLPFQYAWKNQKIGSVGIAIPGSKLYLADDAGKRIVTPRLEGEVIFEGDSVTLGYAESYKDLERGDSNRGVLKTGDLAYMDEDGFLYISGRKSRFVKICGKRIGLDSIETYMRNNYPEKVDCAVIGNDTKIYVIIDKDMCSKVRRDLLQYFPLHKDYLAVCYAPKIPRTASGKVQYGQLIKEYFEK